MLIWGSLKTTRFGVGGVPSLANYWKAYTNLTSYQLLLNSILYALGTCFVSLIMGTSAAWIIERTDIPLRRLFYSISLAPLIIPSILNAIAWIFLLSPKIGILNLALMRIFGLNHNPFNVYSLGGMIWIEGLHFSPLVFLMMTGAFRSIDPSFEEAATMSGASILATLRRVTLKLMLPSVASVMLIIFTRGLGSFTVPIMAGLPGGVQVFTSKIYLAVKMSPADLGLASTFAVSLLLISALGVYIYNRITSRAEQFATITGKGFRPRVIYLGRWRHLAIFLLLSYISILVVLPLFILLWSSFTRYYSVPSLKMLSKLTLENYLFIFQFSKFRTLFLNTFVLAISSASIVMFLTAIIAWLTVKTRIPGRRVLDAVTFLPITFPGIVLGVSLMWAYLILPIPIYGTIWILIVAYVTRFMPFGIRACSASMLQIHPELEEVAQVSGGSWIQNFFRITLPLLKHSLLGGWLYVIIISFRELSTPILLYSSKSMVLSIMIFDLWNNGRYPTLAALSVILIIILLILVTILQKVRRDPGYYY